jgi:pyranose oxidase
MLPLAVTRVEGQPMVQWTATDTILGPQLMEEWKRSEYAPTLEHKFQILSETLAVQLHYLTNAQGTKQVDKLLAKCLRTGKQFIINGKVFIICANSFNTPQLLHFSKIRPPALGRYLNEQSTLFCQVVLKNEIIEEIEAKKIKSPTKNCCNDAKYQKFCVCKDSFPILADDPIPNVWIPNSEKFPFHVQLQRDSYPYGVIPGNMGTSFLT